MDGGADAGGLDGGVDAGIPVPTGDGCADPIPLIVVDGGAYAVGDTSSHEDRGAGSCGGFGGKDVVYELRAPRSGNIMVTVTPLSSGGLQPVVYMSALCDTPKYCVTAGTVGATATLLSPAPSGGKYYLWVDGAPGTAGPYALNVTSFTGMGESCGSPLELTFGSGEATVSAEETSWSDHTHGSCETWNSTADHVYRLKVDRVQNLDVYVTAEFFRGDTYLRAACGGGELVCTGGTRIRQQGLAPGTYYLWRDSPGGSYDLFAHLWEPIPGDTCATARALVFSEGENGGTATDTATTVGTFDNGGSRCSSPGELDVVYTFTTSRTFDFQARAPGQALTLRSETCTGAELGCAYDTITRGTLPPGKYYLWVDSRSSSTGAPFTLSATLTPPVLGDTCENPEPLVFSNGALGGDAEGRGDDLTTRFNNSAGSCAGSTSSDHVYTFTTSKVLDFRASTAGHGLYLRSADCQSGTELVCGHYPAIEVPQLAAGTYYLWVDGGGGPFTVRASLTEPACQRPIPLVFTVGGNGGAATASADGDTSSAFSITQASCGGSGGRDVAYTFQISEPLRLDATVTPKTSGFRPVLYLRASCDADERACAVSPTAGSGATLSTEPLPPGTYYLWVDGFSGSAGAFSLSATLH
jgi:hypothetical protein